MGNGDYNNRIFSEALALYDAVISIDPEKASYKSNKSATLTSLGRLLEAVFEAREAIRLEPFYQRAHNRLATSTTEIRGYPIEELAKSSSFFRCSLPSNSLLITKGGSTSCRPTTRSIKGLEQKFAGFYSQKIESVSD
ncbi:inactive TPR repeat-containing thioredoxin TTL3 isoform X2 [Helianthus annuus]|uniref:inactive TPR repeat-containing thioredoxin TTL3 isoform X2 n=1 Tax=Helianthus annuus TaxID=4232 RepID=UPI000B8FDABF|nr:inactive TPR repeat-containing thioredoxin TTL3 isoform X2 [Helianthus annuus]XP_022034273.1 inactive TPR repeat-containing thioredoxin TTL3 isoform X2 [Helianthus annuus]XP_035845535.1 inactive TPR repeat-containing thioredoxin TTL3 isoform X2 [Helianthus annuus]